MSLKWSNLYTWLPTLLRKLFSKSQPDPAEAEPELPKSGETAPPVDSIPENGDFDPRTAFIEDFLVPIAGDGKIESLEETPLIVAFHAYGIGKLMRNDFSAIDSVFTEAIRSASEQPARTKHNLTQAWHHVLRFSEKLTEAEFDALREWFNSEAKKHEHEMVFGDPVNPIKFRNDSLDHNFVALFYKYFSVARTAATPETTPPDEAVGEMESPPAKAPEAVCVDFQCDETFTRHVVDKTLAQQLTERAPSIVADMDKLLDTDGLPGLAFDRFRESTDEQAIVVSELAEQANLWFVGDVHGDLLGLECVFRYIEQYTSPSPATIVMLGDLFDDGDLSYEVVLLVYDQILKNRSRICVIAGNHDEGLGGEEKAFRASVLPANFIDWLNQHHDDETAQKLGRLTIQFFAQTPRALFFPDGLMAAHGGVPHSDLLDGITTRQDLSSPQCLQDYVWTRLHKRARIRIPNRSTRGCEIGRENFEQFCERASSVIGQPVQRIVRGHDHIEQKERFSVFSRYVKNPVLTINTMCHRLAREVYGPYERTPCIARWVKNRLPEVHRLQIPTETIVDMYPPQIDQEPEGGTSE